MLIKPVPDHKWAVQYTLLPQYLYDWKKMTQLRVSYIITLSVGLCDSTGSYSMLWGGRVKIDIQEKHAVPPPKIGLGCHSDTAWGLL